MEHSTKLVTECYIEYHKQEHCLTKIEDSELDISSYVENLWLYCQAQPQLKLKLQLGAEVAILSA